MTVYDINKAAYKQQKTLSRDKILSYLPQINKFLTINPSNYYMLLNNELHYYTMFVWKNGAVNDMTSELLKVVKSLGEVKGIEVQIDMIEFWVYDKEKDDCFIYPFFSYAEGVIEI